MAVPSRFRNAAGSYSGTSKLHLSWLPEDERVTEGPTTLDIVCHGDEGFAEFRYRWLYDGVWQIGTLIVASNSRRISTGGWADNWHQMGAVMALTGTETESGMVNFGGHYQVKGHPDWGWRFELEVLEDESVAIRMFNISPEGDEEWAVDALYTRD